MDEKKNKKFISEKIVGREMTAKRALKYLGVSLLSGLLFGAAAYAAFYVIHLYSDKKAAVEETTEAAVPETQEPESTEPESPVETTTESAEETAGSETETAPESASAEPENASPEAETSSSSDTVTEPESAPPEEVTEPALSEEDVEKMIEDREKKREYKPSDLYKVLSAERDAVGLISPYIVTVDRIISETTWFESTIETKRTYSGVIVQKNDREILVLTIAGAFDEGDTIYVTFAGGARQNAIVKKESERDGLLILAVPTEGLGQEFLETAKAVTIAQNKTETAGEPVIAAGSPQGAAGSYDFGYINYVRDCEETVDGSLCALYAGVNARPELGTFLMDLHGRLLGIAFPKTEDDPVSGARFLTTKSLSQVIDGLKKGSDLPYFGISGMNISFDMKYKNMPEGLYVTDVENGSPAFTAGIKRGDILVSAMEKEILGTEDYSSLLRLVKPGDEIPVTVKRSSGVDEYTDIELSLTAGIR